MGPECAITEEGGFWLRGAFLASLNSESELPSFVVSSRDSGTPGGGWAPSQNPVL
jgi:hypothetical protein